MSGKNLKVNLIANTSQFKSAMAETSNQMKLINSEFKSAAAETDQYGNKLDATGAKKKQLNGVIQQYTHRIKSIKEEQKHWTRELEKGNITEEQHAQKQQELARRLNNTEAEMKRYEGQLKKLNAEGKATRKTYAEFDKQFRDVGKTMRDVGAQVGIAAGVGFMAMKKVLGDVVNEAKDFHAQMSEVQAISGATAEEMKVLTDQSKDLGKATKFTAQEASQSQANLARAGFKVNEIYDAMPGLLDLAASSNLDLGTSANITSNIIRTFGYEASKSGKVADVLAKGAATANTDVQGLGQAMEVAGPVANSLDIALEQVAASAGIMADAGIDGSKSGRMLRQGMLRLAKPTGEAAKQLEKMKVEAFDADGNMKSLDKVVAELEKGLKGQTKQQKAAALATIFGSESTAGWTVLLDKGSKELADYTKELENSEGAAKEMADVMQDNAQGAIIRMESSLSGLKIELGEKLLPILAKGADFVGDLANKISEWDEETITTIAHTALLATGVLGATTVVAGLVAGLGAFMMVAGPIGLAIAGGTLLLGGLAAAVYKNTLETKKLAEEQAAAKQDALDYGANLSEGTKKGVKGYTDLYENAKIKMVELRNMSGDEATKTVKEIQEAFSQMTDIVIAELEMQRDELSRVINEIYGSVGDAGKTMAEDVTNEVLELFDKDIAEYKKARDTVNSIIEEYGENWNDYPPKIQQAYSEAYAIMDQGAGVFAKTQREMQAIQERIVDQGGAIQNEQAKKFSQQINDTYHNSLNAMTEYFAESAEILDQGLAQGYITQEEYDRQMKGLHSIATGMYEDANKQRDEALKSLVSHLDTRGKLLDLATGKELERETIYERIDGAYGARMEQRLETDEEYFERWQKMQDDNLKSSADLTQKTSDVYKQQQEEFLQSMGWTVEESVIYSKMLREGMAEELEKGNEQAHKAGQDLGDHHMQGLDGTTEGNTKTAEEIVSEVEERLSKGDKEAYEYGKAKGDHHILGLGHTVDSSKNAAENFSKATDEGLSQGKPEAEKHGKEKGDKHAKGVDSTKGINVSTTRELIGGSIAEFKKGSEDVKASGKDKGDAHSTGIDSTRNKNASTTRGLIDESIAEFKKGESDAQAGGKGKGDSHSAGIRGTLDRNTAMAGSLSSAVSRVLGRTSDGGGGRKAGQDFSTGLSGRITSVRSAGSSVASSGVSGLRSVSSSGAGADFVSGFTGSIKSRTGIGSSVWKVASSLGSSALSALKSSIASRSPSRLTGEEGINFTDGFTLAIDKGKKESVRASALVGKESVEALNEEVKGFKQSFGAIALAVEGNKQTLKVEHTLGSKFDEFASMFMANKNDDNNSIKELLNATLQQNSILMQLLEKTFKAEVAFDTVYNPLKARLKEDEYSRNKQRRR